MGLAKIGYDRTIQSLFTKVNKRTDRTKQIQKEIQKSQLNIFEINLGPYICPFSLHPHLVIRRRMKVAHRAKRITFPIILAPSFHE